jgi:hypothetical protein
MLSCLSISFSDAQYTSKAKFYKQIPIVYVSILSSHIQAYYLQTES